MESGLEKIKLNPKFRKHWHGQFEIEELRTLLELINKIYRRDNLTDEEFSAANNLKNCISDTGYERRTDPVHRVEKGLVLARAISASVQDPLWRECLQLLVDQRPKPDTLPA
jgi:hypothetical protein